MICPTGFLSTFSRFAIIALMSLGLAGCYDIETTMTFKPDGTAAVSGRVDFPRDAKYVADFYKSVMLLQPATAKFFNEGLCQSIEKLGAANPKSPINIKSHEYTTKQRFGCGFVYEAGGSAEVLEKLKSGAKAGGEILTIEEAGPQQVRIQIDLNKIPDMSQALPGMIMMGAMQYGQKNGQMGAVPNMDAVNQVAKSYADAALAMTRMSAPNNHLQFSIAAAKVIDTNGERDGNIVRFRWSWEEFVRMMMKPGEGKPESKIYYAVIEY